MLRKHKKKGQSIVEMALLFPLFLLVVVGGIVDFGFAFYNVLALQQIANDAASSAAEKAALNLGNNVSQDPRVKSLQISAIKPGIENDIRAYIANYNSPPVNWQEPGIYTLTTEWLPMSDGSSMIRVALDYKSKTYTPFYQICLNATTGNDYLNLRTQATYKIPNIVKNR